MKESIKQIWFDLDGTLAVQTDEWNAAHDQVRYLVYAELVGRSVDDVLRAEYDSLYEAHKSNSSVFRALGQSAGYWIDHYEAADLSDYYKPNEEVSRTMGQIAQKFELGLFTNNKRAVLEKTLDNIDLDIQYFTKILTGDLIKERKPHPHGFEVMLKMSGLQPQEILYVGDRYHVDIEPAQKLGMQGALVWSRDERADYNFMQFSDIVDLLG